MRVFSRASVAAAAVLFVAVAGYSTSLTADLGLSKDGKTTVSADMSYAAVSEPSPQDLPDGPGKEAVERLCSGCHDLTFTISTRKTETEWAAVVNDMRSKGADGTEEEFAQVIAYLTTHMGKAEAR